MTEKRFTIEPTGIRECIVDNTNGEQLDTFDYTERLCELLNELVEENEQLKQSQSSTLREFQKGTKKIQQLAKENKELKFQLNLLREQANEFHRGARENANRAGQLEKENKYLKNTIKEAYTNERTQLGKSVLKQLIEAIQ